MPSSSKAEALDLYIYGQLLFQACTDCADALTSTEEALLLKASSSVELSAKKVDSLQARP
jgi:hypothetical protein